MGRTNSSWFLQAGLAIRANAVPGLVLWLVASSVVGVYALIPEARPVFDVVAKTKLDGGYLFSAVATALFAGVIPFLVRRGTWRELLFLTLLWGWRGIEVDAFYRLQEYFFGDSGSWSSIAAKVAVDLFVYNVLWAAHLQLLAYRWKDSGFRVAPWRDLDVADYWRRQYPVALISTWAVWLPVVTLVYVLPGPLQVPLFNLAACFWAFVVLTLTSKR